MALTEIPIELSSTPSIVDNGNATAITIGSDESATFAGNILHAGDLTLDVAGDIILDADGADYFFKNGGTEVLRISGDATPANVYMRVMPSDGDFIIKGNDGGSTITALSLDMSAAGAATFNSTVTSAVGQGSTAFYANVAGSYQQFNAASSNAWALGATGGNTSPATAASTTFGFHNWNGSAWSNPLAIAATGDLTGTSNTTGLAASFLNSHADGYGMRVTTYSNAAQYGFAVDSYGGGYSRDFTVGVDGNVNVLTGNLVIATAGKGIDFSANTNYSGMTSELLDSYETGTWTPSVQYTGGVAGIVHSAQFGYYTKIGNRVFLQCYVRISAVGTSTGDVLLGGFPYAQNSNSAFYSLPVVWYNNMTLGTDYNFEPYGAPGGTFIRMYRIRGQDASGSALPKSALSATTDFMMSFNYAT